jgi:hypothetical protein
VSDIDDLQIELIEVLSLDGEIDLVDLPTDRVRELRDAQ